MLKKKVEKILKSLKAWNIILKNKIKIIKLISGKFIALMQSNDFSS